MCIRDRSVPWSDSFNIISTKFFSFFYVFHYKDEYERSNDNVVYGNKIKVQYFNLDGDKIKKPGDQKDSESKTDKTIQEIDSEEADTAEEGKVLQK